MQLVGLRKASLFCYFQQLSPHKSPFPPTPLPSQRNSQSTQHQAVSVSSMFPSFPSWDFLGLCLSSKP